MRSSTETGLDGVSSHGGSGIVSQRLVFVAVIYMVGPFFFAHPRRGSRFPLVHFHFPPYSVYDKWDALYCDSMYVSTYIRKLLYINERLPPYHIVRAMLFSEWRAYRQGLPHDVYGITAGTPTVSQTPTVLKLNNTRTIRLLLEQSHQDRIQKQLPIADSRISHRETMVRRKSVAAADIEG